MLDEKDKQILRLLQRNARISNTELAEHVNLSPTPCIRRVKRLEEKSYINGYFAKLDTKKLGLEICAFVFVQLERNRVENADRFESAIQALPEVIDCFVLAGGHDYMLRVVAKNLLSFEKFTKEKLANIQEIAKIETTISLNQVKGTNEFPVA